MHNSTKATVLQLVVLSALLPLATAGQFGEPIRQVAVMDASLFLGGTGGLQTPYFDRGFLIFNGAITTTSSGPNIVLVDRDGRTVLSKKLWFEDSVRLGVSGVSVDDRQNVVAAASVTDTQARIAHVLALLGPSGAVVRLIRTNPFIPLNVCFGPDGNIWVFGRESEPTGEDYDLLRQYDRNGKLLKTLLPKSSFTSQRHPASEVGPGGWTKIRASADRIGIYSGPAGEWIEVDMTGSVVVRVRPPLPNGSELEEIAYTLDGAVYATLMGLSRYGLYKLNREGRTWDPVVEINKDVPPDFRDIPFGRLVGEDGNDLVLTARAVPYWHGTLLWFHQLPPKPRGTVAALRGCRAALR
jgi:hypothetical protein